MIARFYKRIPGYQMGKFCSVWSTLDNLKNVLNVVEIVNLFPGGVGEGQEGDFDVGVFYDPFCRAYIKKPEGFFSMAIPFSVIEVGDAISFFCEFSGENVGGKYLACLKSSIETLSERECLSHEEIVCSLMYDFELSLEEATRYCDAFISLLAKDHGYFRFDDDPKNERGDFHPRYHFDFFMSKTAAVKIGVRSRVGVECFKSLCDHSDRCRYLEG